MNVKLRNRPARYAGVAMATALLLSAAACSSGDSDKSGSVDRVEVPGGVESETGSRTGGGAGTGTQSDPIAVGEKVSTDFWELTVTGVADPQEPARDNIVSGEGMRWVGVDYRLTNISDEERFVSTLMCFDLRDADGNEYVMDTFASDSDRLGDGDLAPGATIEAAISFEVPADATGLLLRFECSIADSGEVFVALG